jgi:hypothetical protein
VDQLNQVLRRLPKKESKETKRRLVLMKNMIYYQLSHPINKEFYRDSMLIILY